MGHGLRVLLGAFSVSLAVAACSGSEGKNNPCYDPLASGCGTGGAGGEGGSLPAQPTTFFEGTYTAGPVDYAWAFNQETSRVANLAVAFDWAAVEAAVANGTLLGTALNDLELEFSTGVEAKKRSPKALLALGLSLGKAAGGDAKKNDLALQYVEKSLLVLTELYAFHELKEAVDAAVPADATKEIDAAAIMLATLESRMIKRSSAAVPDVWGAGTTLITNDKLAAHTGELLQAARDKYTSNAPDAKAALEAARIYATKYFYASVLNYGYQVETDIAAGGDGAIEAAEGGTFSEGLSTGFFGTSDADAAAMRALWTGAPASITVPAARTEAIRVYVTLADHAASYYTLPEQPTQQGMLVSAGQLQGAVEVLSEALGASAQDVNALRMKAADLVAKSAANDLANAAPLATELDTALQATLK